MERYPGWNLTAAQRARAELLGLALAAARRLKGQGGCLTAPSELHHEHNASPYWNESYYFNFTDLAGRIGGFTRIGMVPNQKTAIAILFLFLEDGGILMTSQTEPIEASRDDVSVGALRYERARALWEWRILFKGSMLRLSDPRDLARLGQDEPSAVSSPQGFCAEEVDLELSFIGWSPCHDFKDVDPHFIAERFVSGRSRLEDLRAMGKVASEHYEQVGEVAGSITIGGRTISFQGSGQRDHSWGERDWKAPRGWTWLTAQFGKDLGFNLSRVMIRSLDLFNGYVSRNGRNYRLRRARLETAFEADGQTQKSIRIRLQDTSGWEAEIEGSPRNVVPLTLTEGSHRTRVNEAFTLYRWGGREGYGISEYLHQLTCKAGPSSPAKAV
ncbi:MAG: hypothetical protein AB1640_03595 [bacterium]